MAHNIHSHVIECKLFNDKIALRVEAMALCQDAASPHLVSQQNQHWGAHVDGVGNGCLVIFLLVST